MSTFRRLFSGGRRVPATYYGALREVVSLAHGLSFGDAAQVLVAHDTLLRESEVESEAPVVPLFDEGFYLTTYPDVAAAVRRGQLRDGFDHFVRWGRGEGRTPSPTFARPQTAAVPPAV
jgi:hypothetical protein